MASSPPAQTSSGPADSRGQHSKWRCLHLAVASVPILLETQSAPRLMFTFLSLVSRINLSTEIRQDVSARCSFTKNPQRALQRLSREQLACWNFPYRRSHLSERGKNESALPAEQGARGIHPWPDFRQAVVSTKAEAQPPALAGPTHNQRSDKEPQGVPTEVRLRRQRPLALSSRQPALSAVPKPSATSQHTLPRGSLARTCQQPSLG